MVVCAECGRTKGFADCLSAPCPMKNKVEIKPMIDPVDPEKINGVRHYEMGGLKLYDVIQRFGLNFNIGNVWKYTCRAGIKSVERLEDLMKAKQYLEYEIAYERKKLGLDK